MKKHFVEFFSPGTFVAESSTMPVDSWDVKAATKLADDIVERHGARPYGFQFVTRERGDNDLDSKETKRSGTYYLGGEVKTVAQLKREKNPRNDILISNMECNHWDKVVVNTNSYRWTQPLQKDDVVLDYKMKPLKSKSA